MINKNIQLNNGSSVPVLGFGTWKAAKNEVGAAVNFAVAQVGYRHIDCASVYENEEEIGAAFKELIGNVVKREELYVVSKLWNTDHRPENVEKAVRKTLSDLKLDYLDLYLMHWGIAFVHGQGLHPLSKDRAITDEVPVQATWQAMEDLVKKGLVKSIGVANFTTTMIVDLLTYAQVSPVMNQIEVHPYNTQEELVRFCQEEKIAVTAYSPLGRPGMVNNGIRIIDEDAIIKAAAKYNKTPAQIILNWGLGRGTVVIPKSVTPERITENAAIFDFELSAEDRQMIDYLNKNHRFVDPNDWWKIPYFS